MIWRLVIVTAIVIMGRFIENSRRIRGRDSIKVYYECLNIHLSLSLGVFAIVWGFCPQHLVYILLFILAGVVLKGVFSNHNPDSLSWRDSDALLGLWLPNLCAITSACLGGFLLIFMKAEVLTGG